MTFIDLPQSNTKKISLDRGMLRTSMEKPWYMFMPDYFMDDLWNTVDVACLVINGFVINSIFRPAGRAWWIWWPTAGILGKHPCEITALSPVALPSGKLT